jgi:hypothetical protein
MTTAAARNPELSLPDDRLEALADLIAERLAARAAGELITPAELARRLGRSRDWIYDHAEQLGGIRIGNGDRPRVFFPWPLALEPGGKRQRRKPPIVASTRPRRRKPTSVELLPIRGKQRGGRDPL